MHLSSSRHQTQIHCDTQTLQAYLEGEDAPNEEEDCKNQAHVVGGHDVLFVRECPRLKGKESGRDHETKINEEKLKNVNKCMIKLT